MVKNAASDGRPHPEERACEKLSANSNLRARVSKDEDGPLHTPSCFETHRSAPRRSEGPALGRAAMLLSMRAGERCAFWPNEATRRTPREEPTCTCGRQWSVACGLLFTMKIPTETCGRSRAPRILAKRTQGLSPVVPAQAGTHDHRPVFMGPDSRYARPGRRSLGGVKHQPAAAENDNRRRASVSRLFFTGDHATATCR